MKKFLTPSMLCLFAFFAVFILLHGTGHATSVGFSGDTAGDIQWPWIKFFNSLAEQLTGPIPMVLGILGIAGCAIAMFTGNAGGGTTKFILLIFVISTCLFAPQFMIFIRESAGGLTILGAM